MSKYQKGGSSIAEGEKIFGRVVWDDFRDNGERSPNPEDSGFYSNEMRIIRGLGAKM